MRAVVKTMSQTGHVILMQKEIPGIAEDEVLIRVTTAGICGTDYHIFKWDEWAGKRIRPPVVLGHEFAGTVEETGSKVKHLHRGQRVSAEGHLVCGTCRYCRKGLAHVCENVRIIGVDRDGCFADYIAMPAYNIWPLGDHIPDRYGAIMDPLGNAMHTVTAQPVEGRTILITGAGSIGLFVVAIARVRRAGRIVVSEPNPRKRTLAMQLGADTAVDPSQKQSMKELAEAFQGEPPDVVLEMSGAKTALLDGLELLAKGGDMALLGIPTSEIPVDFNSRIIFKGITLRGITGRKMFETWQQCDDFLRHHAKSIEPVLTHKLKPEEIGEGFALMEKQEAIKILLDMRA